MRFNYFRIIIIRLSSFFYFKKRSKVIFYHDIHLERKYTKMSTPLSLFRCHIDIIRKSGYEIVSSITHRYGQVEISFDDGFLGLYENINTIIDLQVPINLFVVTSYIDQDNYINKSQLLSLNSNHLITIGSHTDSHPDLTVCKYDNLIYELKTSKLTLESILGNNIDTICFPYGRFNSQVVSHASKVGYKRQYCSLPGFYYNDIYRGVKKRSLVQFAQIREFKAILKGGDHLLYLWYFIKHYRS